jgi:hypothetical protein
MKPYYKESAESEMGAIKWLLIAIIAPTLVAAGFGFIHLAVLVARHI